MDVPKERFYLAKNRKLKQTAEEHFLLLAKTKLLRSG
jgi:hypothetical protein